MELTAGSAGSTGSRGSGGNGGSKVKADPHPTRAGGQDDGSLPNSLKFVVVVIFLTSEVIFDLERRDNGFLDSENGFLDLENLAFIWNTQI